MPRKTQWHHVVLLFGAIAILSIFLYRVRSILPPFLVAFVIAWLLDPLIDRLQERGISRVWAVSGVYLVFLAAFALALVFLIPLTIDQAKEFAEDFPVYSERFSNFTSNLMSRHHETLVRFELPTTLQEVFSKYGRDISTRATYEVSRLSGWLASNLSKVLWLVLIPLVAFYFLNDIDNIRKRAVLFIPEAYRDRTTAVLAKTGIVFSSYVRGLVIVCLLYGVATTIVLAALQMKYGIILGLLAGVLYAVPYLGAILTTVLVFLVGLATYPSGVVQAGWAAGAMIVLNQVFDLVVTPKVLGKSVGLHPILSLFALLAGAELFGLVGMVLAVPVAASIQEIVMELHPHLRPQPKHKGPVRKLLQRKRRKAQP